jgi:hypothetical protein
MLEPCAVKVACTVLRGERGSNPSLSPDGLGDLFSLLNLIINLTRLVIEALTKRMPADRSGRHSRD